MKKDNIIRYVVIYLIVSTIIRSYFLINNTDDKDKNKDNLNNGTKEKENTNSKKIDYNTLSKCILLQETNRKTQEIRYFVSQKIQDIQLQDNSAIITISYTNIKDDSKIAEFKAKDLQTENQQYSYTEVGDLYNYLLDYDYIQVEYTIDDIDGLLKNILRDLHSKDKEYVLN